MFVRYDAGHEPFTRWHKVDRTYDVPVDQEGTISTMYYSACGLFFYSHDNNISDAPDGDDAFCQLLVCQE